MCRDCLSDKLGGMWDFNFLYDEVEAAKDDDCPKCVGWDEVYMPKKLNSKVV